MVFPFKLESAVSIIGANLNPDFVHGNSDSNSTTYIPIYWACRKLAHSTMAATQLAKSTAISRRAKGVREFKDVMRRDHRGFGKTNFQNAPPPICIGSAR